jgi:transcriptional antiterminator RfaH
MRSMRNWYLIKTKPRQEKTAISNLENQEYSTYCPIVIINNKHVVLFPGYIFFHLDKKKENWLPIRSTKVVVNFVRFGLNFAQVPDNVIEYIKANQLINKEKLINLNKFKPGYKIQITNGVFKNCVAIFKSFKSDERVILLMDLLGQQQAVTIKQGSVIGL